ncbi:hypothetical protein GGR42_002357 [Saonia flava]|uniref:Uncharacterized protein n=1 Tax=Saonia flava TaxID=523696 RepID=A0A846R1T2_9FLAO|nr:hypothetical protein [Saonia flava]NJB71895.1 hypothetical protein [Saonia flava]
MKTLFISLFLMVSINNIKISQESETMTATFDGFEEGIYYFTDKDGYANEFSSISDEAMASYDLTQDTYKGKSFLITYIEIEELDEFDEEITINSITALKLLE